MTRVLSLLGICFVLALDWLALDDITTGHQPSFSVEWTFICVSLPVLWALVALARRRNLDKRAA